jgi:rare lipoprotein A
MTILIKYFTRTSSLILLFILISCASVPKFTINKETREENRKADNELQQKYKNVSLVLETVIGPASFYAEQFHGRLTSNGEVYDMNGLTAAHNTYPPNTIIRVTNLSNNKKVIIRVNDHFPKHPTRIIDLSKGTAQVLDMIKDGVTEVKLEVLEWGEK